MRNPPVLQEGHPMPSAPIIDEDEEAALEAARHRYHASVIVRDHLESHAANNPGASSDYVTWIATLHPENAEITVDQRFFIPGNPWWTIYEDTKNDQIPTATAVPVSDNDDDDDDDAVQDQQHQNKEDEENANSSSDASNEEGTDSTDNNDDQNTTTTQQQQQQQHFCKTCSPVSILFGILVCIPALIGVLFCEMGALFLCYLPGALFYHAAQCLSPPNCCTVILYAVFWLLYGVLSLCDSILLLVSVLVTELVAIVCAYSVGFCTGGVLWARYLHQQIRRLCHGVRIVFRRKGTSPPRNFCGFGVSADDDDDETTSANEHHDGNNNEHRNGGVGGGDNGNGNGNYNDIENNTIVEPVVSITVNHEHSQRK